MKSKKQRVLTAKKKYTKTEIDSFVLEYQQTRDKDLLEKITDACSPIILKNATKKASSFRTDMYEVVSDMIQVLYLYIDKYKPSKYSFIQSFNMFLRYNKSLCDIDKPQLVPIKLTADEKKKSLKELKSNGITRSRNGKTFHTQMAPIEISDSVINKFTPYTDENTNIASIVECMVDGDQSVYFELVMDGATNKEIIRKHKDDFNDRPEDTDMETYIDTIKDELREIYTDAVAYYNCIFDK